MQYQSIDTIAATQHGLITRKQMWAFATDRQIHRMVSQGQIEIVAASIFRMAGSADTWLQRLMVTQLWNPESVISHRAALRFYGIDEAVNDFPWVEITVPSGRSPSLRNVKVHRAELITGVTTVDGFRITNVAKSLIDSAWLLPPLILKSYVEHALFKRLVTFPMLRSELAAFAKRGRRGVGVIRELLDLYDPIDDLAQIGLERNVLKEIRRLQMSEPVPQFEVWVEGRQRFIDFAYPDLKIGIEAHSVIWHQRLTAFEKDADRDGALTDAGWRIFYATQVNMTEQLLRVRNQLDRHSRAWVG